MPLRDHFRPPLDDLMGWEGFYGGWPVVIIQQLNLVMPPEYAAAPRIHFGLEDSENGPVSQVSLTDRTEIPEMDEYQVRVYDMEHNRRLVAAVEIVSPANKDRPEHRRLFVAKCAALLQQRVCVAIIDLVTVREFNLYADLMELIGQNDPSLAPTAPSLYAVACRWRPTDKGPLLESWNQPLSLGRALPTLPLWLADNFAVPLELEASYEQTCRDLRIE